MLAKVYSAAVVGLDAVPVEVEVDIASQGLPSFTIVGLPDKAVEEAKERVRSAIRNSGADFPARRITVNLAPADLPKEGPSYDLPIAFGILLASGQLQADLSQSLLTGELSLDGRVRPTTGVLAQALLAKESGIETLFVPEENASEAAIVAELTVYPVKSLKDLFLHLTGEQPLTPAIYQPLDLDQTTQFDFDMADIRGQHQAKRALEIAAAGGHNILMKGPPGAGKTLLARTLSSILPRLTFAEAIEVTKIYSISGMLPKQTLLSTRPFRSPHHSTSLVGLIGGSSNPRPGEITLAHRGVLFLDELPEFPRHVLETLRQPIEDGVVHIARAASKVSFPAKCMLVTAQNPCPCGYYGDTTKHCSCNSNQILRYQRKVSGPLLDRIDIHLDVPAVKVEKLADTSAHEHNETSIQIRERVQKARERQTKRFEKTPFLTNADLSSKAVTTFVKLSPEATSLLAKAVSSLHLSGRSYYRTIKVSQTIADLAGEETVLPEHVAEALQFRPQTPAVV
jgi:magnesium chelatase family protein